MSAATSARRRAPQLLVAVIAGLALVATPWSLAPAAARPSPPPSASMEVAAFVAAHPGASRSGPNQVSWHDGAVVMTFPDESAARTQQAQAASSFGCSSGWSCLYEDSWFGGRRLQFRDCGYTQHLADYGFAGQTSSWVNNRGPSAVVRDRPSGSLLWTAPAYSHDTYVGSYDNDRADSIYLGC